MAKYLIKFKNSSGKIMFMSKDSQADALSFLRYLQRNKTQYRAYQLVDDSWGV